MSETELIPTFKYDPITSDQIFYINLKHRTDRRKEIEAEVAKMGWKATRFDAVRKPYGAYGCCLSHIGVLEIALKRGLKQVLVLEDDAIIYDIERLKEVIKNMSNLDFDMFCLSHNTSRTRVRRDGAILPSGFARATDLITTGCYVARDHQIPKLLDEWRTAAKHLEKNGPHNKYAVDIIWKKLQHEGRWLCANPPVIGQRASYSDIEKCRIDYTRQLKPAIKYGKPNHPEDVHVAIFINVKSDIQSLEKAMKSYENVLTTKYRLILFHKQVNSELAGYLSRKRAQGYLVQFSTQDEEIDHISRYKSTHKQCQKHVHIDDTCSSSDLLERINEK